MKQMPFSEKTARDGKAHAGSYHFQMISGLIDACWHPSGVRVFFDRIPGVLLRSTPGYLPSPLRDEKTDFHVETVLDHFPLKTGRFSNLKASCTPAGGRPSFPFFPGVLLRSTPGYPPSPLRGEKTSSHEARVSPARKAAASQRRRGAVAWAWVLLAVALSLLPGAPAEAEIPAQFALGNNLYESGDYAGARAQYEAAAKSGSLSANLFLNLGNACFRVGDKGAAALAYERALTLEPAHPEALANLKLLRQQTGARVPAMAWWKAAVLYPAKVFGNGTGWVAAVGLWVALFAGVIGCFSLFGGQLVPVSRLVWVRSIGILALMLGLWSTGGAYVSRPAAVPWIIVQDRATVRVAPADNSKSLGVLPLGSHVRLILERGQWIYVVTPDGERGWLARPAAEGVLVPAA